MARWVALQQGFLSAAGVFRRAAVTAVLAALIAPVAQHAGAAAWAAERESRLLVLGDSLTSGFGLGAEEAFPARLEAALTRRGFAVKVLDGGVSGDTSAGGRERLDWALDARPDAVILELGGNDGLRGLDPKETYRNLAAILKRLKQRNVPVLVAGMYAPPNLGPDYGKEFKAVFPRLAERFGVPLYPFFLEGVAADPDLNQKDGLHPNGRGVEVIVERMLPFVARLVLQARSRNAPADEHRKDPSP